MAPPHRAIWIPGGAVQQHQVHGPAGLRTVPFDPALVAGQRPEPTVLAVSGLLRELILTLTGCAERAGAARRRLELVTLDELLEATEQPLYLPEPADARLRTAIGPLRADPASRATLASLGEQAGVSERTLSRLFQAELGLSFQQWRTQLRIHHALILLAGGSTVTETALGCGWSNPSSFIDAFTQTVGQTPGSYRAELRSADWGMTRAQRIREKPTEVALG